MIRWTSELIGTFMLVLFGTGAIVVADTYPGTIPHPAIALAFGCVVMTMIYAIGDVSGAHINPAATLAFWLARRLPGKQALVYVSAHIVGAVAASALLRLIFPHHKMLGATLPSVGAGLAFGIEVLASFVLVFVIIHVSQGAKEKGIMAGIAIGGTVAMEALVFGPLTGASMNPARSLGPALVSGQLQHLWIYLLAPLIGAALAILSCRLLREDCCTVCEAPRESA